jgi:hypothetical protein
LPRARLPKVPAKPFDLNHGSVTQKGQICAPGRHPEIRANWIER